MRIVKPQDKEDDVIVAKLFQKGDKTTRRHEALNQKYSARQGELNRRYQQLKQQWNSKPKGHA